MKRASREAGPIRKYHSGMLISVAQARAEEGRAAEALALIDAA